jgi:AcrB/AcrD/AcrF family
MLRKCVEFSLQYRFLVLICAFALMILGAHRLRDTRVDALPEFSAPIIQIQTQALGLSAAEVEDLVTFKLEKILSSVSWLKNHLIEVDDRPVTGSHGFRSWRCPHNDNACAPTGAGAPQLGARAANVSKPPVMLQPLSTTGRAMMAAWDASVAQNNGQFEPTGRVSL